MEPQSKFTNVSGGVAGAIKLNHRSEPQGVAVFPNESIWLTEQEEVLTANAPRNPEDNPFTNGTYRLDVRAADAAEARPIGSRQQEQPPAPPQPAAEPGDEDDPEGIDIKVETTGVQDPPPQETGQAAAPDGEPVAGQRQPTEETAVADAPTEAAPRAVVDPGEAERAVEPEPPKPPAAPAPKPGQSKRAARTDAAAAQPAPATKPKPAAAPVAKPSE